MSKQQSLLIEAHNRAPLLIYTLILFFSFAWPKSGHSKCDVLGPPCRLDTMIQFTWCPGDTITSGGVSYYAAGTYTQFFQSTTGCDSVVSIIVQTGPDTPFISIQPQNQYVGLGDTATFYSAASLGIDCRWQKSLGTGIWLDVQPDSMHGNPFSTSLQVRAWGSDSTASYRYNCHGCLSEVASHPAELRVYPQQPPIWLQLPQIESCVGVNTVIAVRVNNWQNVGRIDLNLIVPSSTLQLLQWSARISGMTISVQGDTVKIKKSNTAPSVIMSGDTLLLLVVRPLLTGALPLTWVIPEIGIAGLQFVDPNRSLVHRLVQVNGQISVPNYAAQVIQQPVSASVQSGDSVSFAALCANALSYRWQMRTGSIWRNLVETSAYTGTQTALLRLTAAPDSLNNASFRLIAYGACGRNDSSQVVRLWVESVLSPIRLTLPQVQACTTGQYIVSLNADSFRQISALSLRVTFNPDSIQFVSTDFIHPALAAGNQILQQVGAISLNWFGAQPLQLGSAELLRLRFQVSGSSLLEWDTTVQGTNAWSPYQQRLRIHTEGGSIVLGPLPVQLNPIPCLFVGDSPIALSAWPPGGTFSGVGVLGQILNVDSLPGIKTVQYQATYQGCTYFSQIAYEVFPAPAMLWLNNRDVCSGTLVTLTARRDSGNHWSTGDSSASIILNPGSDTLVWVEYSSTSGCRRVDSVRIRLRAGPNASVDDTIYYYNSVPVQLRASGGVSYRWHPAAGLSDSLSATPLATPDTTTSYTVVVTDSLGCSRSLRVVVARPRINPAPSQVICRGDSMRLSAPLLFSHQPNSGFAPSFAFPLPTYLWQPTSGLDDPTSANPMASPRHTTAYQVRVVVAQNCTLTAQRGVIVLNPPQLEIGYDSIQTSIGHPVRLLPHIWDTLSPLLYHWTPGTGLSDSTHPHPLANPLSTTTYTLSVQTATGCRSTDSVVVVVSQVNQGAVLQGQLIYDNPGQTPIREGIITLERFPAPMRNIEGAANSPIKRQAKRQAKRQKKRQHKP